MHGGGNAAHHNADRCMHKQQTGERTRRRCNLRRCLWLWRRSRFVHLREMPTLYTTHGVVADPARARCRVSRRVTSVNCGLVPAADGMRWRSVLWWQAQHMVIERVVLWRWRWDFVVPFGPSRISATDENRRSTYSLLLTVSYVNLAIELGFKRLGLRASYIHY